MDETQIRILIFLAGAVGVAQWAETHKLGVLNWVTTQSSTCFQHAFSLCLEFEPFQELGRKERVVLLVLIFLVSVVFSNPAADLFEKLFVNSIIKK